ncbi:MAG: VWA domain-containing protein [Myxococcota bacterium]
MHFGRGRRPALRQREPGNREAYAKHAEADFVSVRDQPLSTFSVDVDTASYSNVRRFLSSGQLPPPDAVRIEELVNYFDYDYVQPTGKKPMTVNWELSECPWNRSHVLARVGLQTKEIRAREVPPRNLVFLLDVSGSMSSPDKLPLLQRGMLMLVDQLREQDTVSIVVYAGAAGLVLPTTHGHDKATIRDAISMLSAGGSTNGGQGIQLAYAQARKAFIKGGVNRVILATDGDFNVGMSSNGDMERLIVRERKSHVFLSVLGFGTGNLQDTKMELLADKGNGNYAYIDSEKEAKKVLVAEAGATLVAAAKDVKLQIELNPAKVASYRLIGYDNRRLANEDFANDKKDAGEMGAGHSVTALYEIVPAGEGRGKRRTARLKYQGERARTRAGATNEWMTVKVRYKRPTGVRSRLLEVPMGGKPKPLAKASRDFRFAAAVAEFGLVLHESDHAPSASLGHAVTVARGALGPDPHGHRAEFLELAKTASRID